MISIISGPSCVGKTHLMENKKDRLLEIVNLESDAELKFFTSSDWDDMRIWTDVMWEEGIMCCSHTPDQIQHSFHCAGLGDRPQHNICIHFSTPNFSNPLIKKISELKTPKSAIILGVPHSEYKVRVKKRKRHKGKKNVQTYSQVLDWLGPHNRPKVYKEWMEELNKKEIPYLLVEAIGDYKVLEEEEFFRMLND